MHQKMSKMLELVPGPYLTAFFIENYLNIQLNGPLVISQQAGSVNFLSLVFSRAAATF